MGESQGQFDPVAILTERFSAAIDAAFPEAAGADPVIQPSKQTKFGDFQCNAAMALAKRLGQKPRDVAQTIVERVDLAGLADPLDASSIAGPGFINVRLDRGALAGLLDAIDTPDLGLPKPAEPETIVVDLCGVNLAKQMHVGHLRSTVIGDALARTFERLGYRVKRQNHVGDWGLPIAMVVQKLREESDAGSLSLSDLTLPELNRLYRIAQAECSVPNKALEIARKYRLGPKVMAELETIAEESGEALERAKKTLVLLQGGDKEIVDIWKSIYSITMTACLATCARLHTRITDEDSAGESSYREELDSLVSDLITRGIAEESDGALVVRVEGIKEPCIVRKRDGGYLYATTDMAAVRRRVRKFDASRAVYAVDARQGLHFKQVFAAAHKAGYTKRDNGADAGFEHAAFGTMLGEDGKPFKTRSGENVRLVDLIDEAVTRARNAVAEKNADLPDDEAARVAEAVGVAAIKYADLSTERIKDYVFSFDRMLAFEGETGPYLLNAVVRIKSIFRKAESQSIETDAEGLIEIGAEHEKSLALTLLRYPSVVRTVAETLEPHRLCAYAYELSRAFTGFYENCPVLRADSNEQMASRLRLCRLTERVLTNALDTLGLPVLDRM